MMLFEDLMKYLKYMYHIILGMLLLVSIGSHIRDHQVIKRIDVLIDLAQLEDQYQVNNVYYS